MPDDPTQIDPSQYATPNQLAAQREYAQKMLQGGSYIQPSSGTGAVSPFQALGGIIQAYAGRKQLEDAAAQERATNQAAGASSASITTDGSQPSGPLSMQPPGVNSQGASIVDKLLPTIAKNEGTGSYTQLGKIIPKTGDRAYGKYQVMGANIPQWTQEILGAPMTPQQFLMNPDAQERVARAKLGQYAALYGPEGAAKAWFAGPHGMNNPSAQDVNHMTVARYGADAMANMGGSPATPGVKVASADPGLPTGALGPSPAPQSAPAAPAAAPGGMMATPPPAPSGGGAQVAQNTQVAAGPGGLSPAVPPMPSMGAPAQTPAGPGGTVAPGMFAQRPRISQQQYQAIMSNPMASPEQKANATAVWQSQNQPVSFKTQYGTVVRGANGQEQFVGDPVDMSIKGPNGDVPVHGFYNADGSIRIAQPQGQGGGAAPPTGPNVQPPPPAQQPPTQGPVPGPGSANQQAMPKFASLEGGTTSDAGMLGANPPLKAVASAPAGVPANPTAAPGGPAPVAPPPAGGVSPASPNAGAGGGVQYAQSMVPQYARDTLNDMGTIAAQQEAKKAYVKGDIENYNKDYAQFQNMGLNAINNRQQINLAQKFIHDAHMTQGPGTPIKLAWEQAKAFLGDQSAQTNLAYNQAFDKVISGGILRDMKTLLGGWAGQVRNAEINLMNKASASSANTIGANQAILDIADKSQRQMEDIGRLTNLYRQGAKFDNQGNPVVGKDGNYVFEAGRTPTSADQNTIIRDYLQSHPLLSKAELDHYNDLLDAAEKGGPGVAQGPLSKTPPAAPGAGAPASAEPSLQELQQEKERRQQQQKPKAPQQPEMPL